MPIQVLEGNKILCKHLDRTSAGPGFRTIFLLIIMNWAPVWLVAYRISRYTGGGFPFNTEGFFHPIRLD